MNTADTFTSFVSETDRLIIWTCRRCNYRFGEQIVNKESIHYELLQPVVHQTKHKHIGICDPEKRWFLNL